VPYLGEIRLFPWSEIPAGWAACQGQLLPIVQNEALFSLLGTLYGGDGQTTFALPDLRGRAAVGFEPGSMPGAVGGEEVHNLSAAELPAHAHAALASADPADTPSPGGSVLASAPIWATPGNPTTLQPDTVQAAGVGKPHPNMQPYLALSVCIAVQGVYPSTVDQ
jgi:microcystin-dependent protein